jgi:hypothetical protein
MGWRGSRQHLHSQNLVESRHLEQLATNVGVMENNE